MDYKLIFDKFILFLLVDVFIYLFWYAYKLHRLQFETSAIEDKLTMCLLSTVGIKAMQYVGFVYAIQSHYILLMGYFGDFGIALSTFLVAIFIAELVKKEIRKKRLKT